MTGRVLKNSLVFRSLSSLRTFYRHSLAYALILFFQQQYDRSRLKTVWERMMGAPVKLEHSVYARMLNRLNLWVYEIGCRLRPAWKNSLAVRACTRLREARILRGSVLKAVFLDSGLKRFMLFLFAMYLPVDFVLRSFSALSALASVWDELFLVFSLFYVLARLMLLSHPVSARVTPLDAALIVFMAVGFILMCVNAPIFSISVSGYRAVVQYMLWFFVVTRLLEDDRDAVFFFSCFVGMGVLISLHGIYQYITDVPIPQGWVSVREMGVRTRVFSILGSPNVMGSFVVMTAPLAAGMAYMVKKTWQKVFMWGCVGVICLACLFTFSRGAWLGMAVAVAVFALYRDKKLLALAALVMGAAVYVPDIANRITYLFTSDFAEASLKGGRSGRWMIGMDLLLKNNPWLGFGLGRFGGAVAMQNQVIEGLDYFYMDNYYLKTLVEMGYVGFGFYLLLIAGFLANGMRAMFRTRKTPVFSMSAGVFAGLAGVLTHSLFENIFEVPYMNAYFWGLAALLLWMGFLRRPKADGLKPRVL